MSSKGSRRRSRLKKLMEATVVPYREELKTAFERLNRQWIEPYFAMEDADRKVLGEAGADSRLTGFIS